MPTIVWAQRSRRLSQSAKKAASTPAFLAQIRGSTNRVTGARDDTEALPANSTAEQLHGDVAGMADADGAELALQDVGAMAGRIHQLAMDGARLLMAHRQVLALRPVGRAAEGRLVAVMGELVVGAHRLGALLRPPAQARVFAEGRELDVGARGVHQHQQRRDEVRAHGLPLCRARRQDRDDSVSDRRRSMKTIEAFRSSLAADAPPGQL